MTNHLTQNEATEADGREASALPDLLPCPFCGGEAVWCCTVPDEDGDLHDCDQIICPTCEFNFDCHNDQTQYACDLESGRIETAKVWNSRAR